MGTFIIAEAGVNHNGNIQLAKQLIDVASKAGCDAVKFQTFKTESLVTKSARKADYQLQTTSKDESQYEMLKKLELDYETHLELVQYAKKSGIIFLSSPFDLESVDLLDQIGMEIYKVPSGEITNKPLLQKIAQKGRPIILSTGMSTLGEVEEALDWIYAEGNHQVTLLHCTSTYPTPMENVNLQAMLTLEQAFKVEVGYSDHTTGIEIPIAAVAMGGRVIEKHFTLDKAMNGPDHKSSLEPAELQKMVESIRNIELALGNGLKVPQLSEKESIMVARKSVVAKEPIPKGEKLTEDMLTIKRPGRGLSPKYLEWAIGRVVLKDIQQDEVIQFEYLN